MKLALKFGLNYVETVGKGEEQRKTFEQNLVMDLERLTKHPSECFCIRSVNPGSVVVGLDVLPDPSGKGTAPVEVALMLAQQARKPSSDLFTGKVTRAIEGVSASEMDGVKIVTFLSPPRKMSTPLLTPPSKSVKLTLKLDLDYVQTVGGGSDKREAFETGVTNDLAAASTLPTDCFRIKSVSPGSVLVGLQVVPDPSGNGPDPANVVKELAEQAKDIKSVLLAGKFTRATKAVHAQDVNGKVLVSFVETGVLSRPPQLLVAATPSPAKGVVSAEVGVADDGELSDFMPLGGGGGHVARSTRAAKLHATRAPAPQVSQDESLEDEYPLVSFDDPSKMFTNSSSPLAESGEWQDEEPLAFKSQGMQYSEQLHLTDLHKDQH